MSDSEIHIVEMIWPDCDPAFYHAKGHHDFAAFCERLVGQLGWSCDPATLVPFCRHGYAAHLQTAMSRSEELGSEIRTFDAPGRGRYKATILDVTAMESAKSAPAPSGGGAR